VTAGADRVDERAVLVCHRDLHSAAQKNHATIRNRLTILRRRNDSTQPLAALFREAKNAEDASDALRVARKFYRWRRDMIHDS